MEGRGIIGDGMYDRNGDAMTGVGEEGKEGTSDGLWEMSYNEVAMTVLGLEAKGDGTVMKGVIKWRLWSE